MSIKQQIDKIIKSRKEKAVKLEEQQGYYKKLLNAFKSLKRKESSRFEVKDDSLRADYTNKIKALELVTAIKLTEEVISSLDDVINRFKRDYMRQPVLQWRRCLKTAGQLRQIQSLHTTGIRKQRKPALAKQKPILKHLKERRAGKSSSYA